MRGVTAGVWVIAVAGLLAQQGAPRGVDRQSDWTELIRGEQAAADRARVRVMRSPDDFTALSLLGFSLARAQEYRRTAAARQGELPEGGQWGATAELAEVIERMERLARTETQRNEARKLAYRVYGE